MHSEPKNDLQRLAGAYLSPLSPIPSGIAGGVDSDDDDGGVRRASAGIGAMENEDGDDGDDEEAGHGKETADEKRVGAGAVAVAGAACCTHTLIAVQIRVARAMLDKIKEQQDLDQTAKDEQDSAVSHRLTQEVRASPGLASPRMGTTGDRC
jgi:hypothetical protein